MGSPDFLVLRVSEDEDERSISEFYGYDRGAEKRTTALL
jgi:hypothetical protein